jgi:hypothetical protein
MELLNYIQEELKSKTITIEAISINWQMKRPTSPVFELNNTNAVDTVQTGPRFCTARVVSEKDSFYFELGEIVDITVTLAIPGQVSVMLVQAFLDRKESSYSSTTEEYRYTYDFICTDIIADR